MRTSTRHGGHATRSALQRLTVVALASLFLGLQLVGAALAAQTSFVCQASGVGVFPKQRIHLRCANPQSGIGFFALSVKKKEAALMLPVFTIAVAQNQHVVVFYDPADLSGEKIGCGVADCRLLQAIEMVP